MLLQLLEMKETTSVWGKRERDRERYWAVGGLEQGVNIWRAGSEEKIHSVDRGRGFSVKACSGLFLCPIVVLSCVDKESYKNA